MKSKTKIQIFLVFFLAWVKYDLGNVVQEDPGVLGREDYPDFPLYEEVPDEEDEIKVKMARDEVPEKTGTLQGQIIPVESTTEMTGSTVPPREKRKTGELRNPPGLYTDCHVSYGFKQNPGCIEGQVCVDKKSKKKVPCSLSATKCSLCSPPSPPPPCPRGCSPGPGCPALVGGTEDGICIDPIRPPEEYDHDASDLGKPHFQVRPGVLAHGASCNTYGDIINNGEASNKEICNWAKERLECIPNQPRAPPKDPSTPEEIEAERRPPGTCQCMIALGGKDAVILNDPKTGKEVCYIPANNGLHSNCDFNVYPPYGSVETIKPDGTPVFKRHHPASKFCVPDSECRTGDKYTGLRCMCKEGVDFHPKTFTCSRGNQVKFSDSLTPISISILLLSTSYLCDSP